MKKNKLSLEKFRILQMNGLPDVKGGDSAFTTGALDYNIVTSELTTYTTDPNVPCPSVVLLTIEPFTTLPTTNHTNNHTTIPGNNTTTGGTTTVGQPGVNSVNC